MYRRVQPYLPPAWRWLPACCYVAVMAVAVLGGYVLAGDLALHYLASRPVLATAVTDAATFVVVLAIRRRTVRCRTVRRRLGARGAVVCAGWLAFAFITGQAASAWLYSKVGSSGYDQHVELTGSIPPVSFYVFVLAIAPMAEEALLRGLLYPVLRRRVPWPAAAAISTACFAVLHGNLVQMTAVIPLGLLLAAVYERTRRLTLVVLLHSAFNTLALITPVGIVSLVASLPLVIALMTAFGLAYPRLSSTMCHGREGCRCGELGSSPQRSVNVPDGSRRMRDPSGRRS